jgi:hypothetical protein
MRTSIIFSRDCLDRQLVLLTVCSWRRRILSTIYDDTSALVAATHGIFAHHYCLLGNLDKAANATTLAIRMLESLSRKQAALADDGFNHAGLYALVRLLVIDVIPSSYVRY